MWKPAKVLGCERQRSEDEVFGAVRVIGDGDVQLLVRKLRCKTRHVENANYLVVLWSCKTCVVNAMSVLFPGPMKDFVNLQIKAGGFTSVEDYLCELVRRDQVHVAEAQLKSMVIEGLNSGPLILINDAYYDSVIERGTALAKA